MSSSVSKSVTSKLKQPTAVSTATNPLKHEFPVTSTGLKRKAVATSTGSSTTSTASKAQKTRPMATARSVISKAPASITTTSKASTSRTSASATTAAAAAKKRPAWDTKGRLQDMENLTSQMKNQMNSADQTISLMQETLQSKTNEIDKLVSLRELLETHLQSKTSENTEISGRLKEIEDENRSLKEQIDSKSRQCDSLQTAVSEQASTIIGLEARQKSVSTQYEIAEKDLKEKCEKICDLEQKLSEALAQISLLDSKLQEEESIRRQLHNTVQELKGNIRVFCRVRPPFDDGDGQLKSMEFPGKDGRELVLRMSAESADGTKTVERKYEFEFDKVFLPDQAQADVFHEISQLVQSALDGYNVCIFAYGQTGSGKTFTMEGDQDDKERLGMIPRAVAQIWEETERLESKGWAYEMEGSYLEIYNETLRDLFGSPGDVIAAKKKHDIKHLPTGETMVTDVNCVKLTSPDQVLTLLKHASRLRQVAETQCNERSSRSHSVFTLRISGSNEQTGEKCRGVLNLIDLAGSERLSQSGSVGDRLKETQAINKSLSALGDVIASLANKEGHIPYRNSKLTFLLQNSLGGNSKTLMFVNVAPEEKNVQESLCSLRFATKVNNCVIGTARKVVK